MKKTFIAGLIGGIIGGAATYVVMKKTKLILPKRIPKGKPAGTYEIEDWEKE